MLISTTRWRTILFGSIVAGTLCSPSLATATHAAVIFTRVTTSDQPAPGVPDFAFAGHLSPPVINNEGEVAFISLTRRSSPFTRSSGIWAGLPGAIELVAVSGGDAPGTDGLDLGGFSRVLVSDTGQVTFGATLTGDGVGLLNNTGIWTGQPGQASLTARLGDPAQGAGQDVVFAPGSIVVPSLVPALSNAGHLAFNSHISGPGVDNFNHSGIWAGDLGNLTLAARANDPLPQFGEGIAFAGFDGPGATMSTGQTPPRINDQGDLAFATTMAGAAFASYPTAHGVLFGQPDNLSLVAKTGDPVPGMPGAIFGGGFGQPGLNNHGDMVFWSFVDFAAPMVLLAGQPDALEVIAVQGQLAPGQTGFGQFTNTVINDQGAVAFSSGPQLFTNVGGEMRLVAKAGNPAPGAGEDVVFDQILNSIFSFEMNSHGQIAFEAILSGPDIDPGTRSLWLWDDGELTLIVRDGQVVDLDPDPDIELLREVELGAIRVGASGGQEGEPSWFNDRGELVFIMNTTDVQVRGGIFIAGVEGQMILSGDLNGDGVFDAFDVAPFELALADRAAFEAAFPDIDADQFGDFNDDGALDAFDVSGFEAALAGGNALVPEPAAAIILLTGISAILTRQRSGRPRR